LNKSVNKFESIDKVDNISGKYILLKGIPEQTEKNVNSMISKDDTKRVV
jgi:hypothetical protein